MYIKIEDEVDTPYSDIVNKAKAWAQRGITTGWLSQSAADAFDLIDERSPASLFGQNSHRPLVIALFGGTGVGKSRLLNRLANQAIARTGVERPTSREVTVYHHDTIKVDQLPKAFPLDKINIASHHDDQFKEIMWIDMPDIDSVEQENRTQVLNWLPHIDVLIYVVNPERYRDNRAWRILLNEGQYHTWIFVMNRCDTGIEAQRNEFDRQLKKAGGFPNPLIYRTDCRTDKPPGAIDEFDQLKETVLSLTHQHMIEQFDLRSFRHRLDALQNSIQTGLDALGTDPTLNPTRNEWDNIWMKCRRSLLRDMEWPIRKVAKLFAQRDSQPEKIPMQFNTAFPSTDQNTTLEKHLTFWNQRAQTHLIDALDQFIADLDTLQIPAKPFKTALQNIPSKATQLISTEAEESLLSSLIRPSFLSQRFVFQLVGACVRVIPLATLNTEKAARRGLRRGIENGLDLLANVITETIEQTVKARAAYYAEGALLIALCKEKMPSRERPEEELLSRILLQ